MNKDEFYKNVISILPYNETKNENEHFRKRLSSILRAYQEWVGELSLDGKPVSEETLYAVKFICNKLKDIVDSSMKGLASTAYIQLRNLLQDNVFNPKMIDLKSVLTVINKGKSFYRMRQMDCVYKVERKELFHIPFDKRGTIKAQRYSTPGYPCLYLGESIYTCWEEMRRPPMYSCAVSRFVNLTEATFLDLTIPCIEKITDNSYIKLLPLIISCMIRVSNDNHTYKPEYIIPQLLIEWVLKQRQDKRQLGVEVHGVMYTSTHRDDEFHFPLKMATNYAIPVFSVDINAKHCKKLTNYYHLTKPTTNEIEQLKSSYSSMFEMLDSAPDMEEGDQFYYASSFGQLEQRLNDEYTFPIGSI